jgi:hypothetical protein
MPLPFGLVLVLRQAEFFNYGERVGGDRLFDLEHVDVIALEVGLAPGLQLRQSG